VFNRQPPCATRQPTKNFEKRKTIHTFAAPLNTGKTLKQSKIMQQYETVVILTPLLTEESAKEVIAKYTKLLKDGGAEIVQEDNWGLKKLAYPIQKKSTGYYHLTEFKAPGDLINKLEVEYRRDERILRFLTIALDKHAIAYNEKKRSGAFNQKKTAKTEEAAS
jgi:small subunit ribosomal protein S6